MVNDLDAVVWLYATPFTVLAAAVAVTVHLPAPVVAPLTVHGPLSRK